MNNNTKRDTTPVAPIVMASGGLNPYYSDGMRTIYHGSCDDFWCRFKNELFDAVVTSPPYNLGVSPYGQFGHWKDGMTRGGNGSWDGVSAGGIEYGEADDAMPYDLYRKWQMDVLMQCWRVIRKTGAIFYVHKPRPQRETLWMPLELNPGLPIRQIVIWDRGSGFNRVPTWYVPTHEWVMVFARQEFRVTTRSVDDVWRISPDRGNNHPAPFPVKLAEQAIASFDCQSVLDPFAGSGTTLVAAKRCGISAVGFEIDERFCEMAANRLSQGMLF